MKKKKLISALMLCFTLILPTKADDISIIGQTINGNIGAANGAGVAVNAAGDTLTITNSTFTNNSGGYSGGIYNSGNLVISDGTKDSHTTFEGNYNSQTWAGGGAIYSYASGTKIQIGDYTSFIDNHSDMSGVNGGQAGGALYIGNATQLAIGNHVNFSDNSANNGNLSFGGAMYIENSQTQIGNNLNVENNSSNRSGGGMSICNIAGANATIGNNATFKNNTSLNGSGGAISSDSTNMQIGNKAVFNGNKAANNGGAIAISSTNNETFTIGSNAQFINNIAGNNGGAIYNDSSLTLNGAIFSGNSAQQGGALYNTENGNSSLANVIFNASNGSAKNDIYNAGSITTSGTNTFGSDINNNGNISFDGTNDILESSNIKGQGSIVNEGTVNLAGDASGYTGEYSQTDKDAVTNVTGTFYGGDSTISEGTLNWNTTNNPESGTIKVSDNAILNIGSSKGEIGDLILNNNSSIADTVVTTINDGSSLILNGGSAIIDSNDTWNGTISVDNANSVLTIGELSSYGTLVAENGTLNFESGTFALNSGSTISDAVTTLIGADANFVINSGNTYTIDSNDSWNGEITLQGGTLNVSDRSETQGNGALDATSGTLNVVNNGNLDIVAGSSIAEAVNTNINNGSTLTINGGNVTLDGATNDTWAGTVNLENGNLVVDSINNAGIVATGGTIDLQNQDFNVSTGSSIANNVILNINNGSSLAIKGGEVGLNTGDKWDGNISLNGGKLSIDNSDNIQNSTIQANSGNLSFVDGTLNIGQGSVIQNSVILEVAQNANIDITTGGVVGVNDGDTLNGTTTLNGGTLNYGVSKGGATNIVANTGYLNLLKDSVLTIKDPSTIADAVVVDIQNGSTLETSSNTVFNLNGGQEDASLNDKWNGTIRNLGGTVNATNIISNGTSALQQYGGTTNIDSSSNIVLDSIISEVTDGTINVTNNSTLTTTDSSIMQGGNLNVDSSSKFISLNGGFNMDNLNHSGMFVGLNNSIEDYTIASNMNIGNGNDNLADFTVDVYGRSNQDGYNDVDRFFANIIKNASDESSATINISDWNLGGDIFGWDAPIDKHINLGKIFNYNVLEGNVNFTETNKEIFTPIGWYKLNNTGGLGGNFTMDLTRFNPQVYRGQVTTLAQYMNQLAVNDMLFNHSMLLPSFKDEDIGYTGTMANKYAAANPVFAPYQYSRKDGGLWYRMYGTFETLQMSQGLSNVGNNAYGTIIGADFGLKELKNGWKFMPTAYIGYNGAHQYFAGMGAYQNGGQAGFLGTWYKNNFIIGGLIYGGVYQNSMDIAGYTDNTFNYFAGAATKAAYNWRFHRDWVLQPNLLLSYNFFGQQNWHSDFGQMGMMSGTLNGINLAPGLNLIWEKETFSIYATLQYMYNLNGAVDGRAGNVSLPHLYMDRGYIQYGFGVTKRFTDRCAGYFQTVFRNVGRTGVGFQLGFNILLGK